MTLMREIQHLLNIIPAPSEVFNDLNKTPRWRMPAAFLFIISPAIGFLIIPAAIEPLRNIYEESFDSRAAEIALQSTTHYLTISYVAIEPFVKIVGWVFLSAAIYIIALLSRDTKPFTYKHVISVVAYSETLFHLMGILTLLIIYARGLDQISDPSDMIVFKGAEYFIDKNSVPHSIYSTLNNFNLFSIWYLAVASRGFQIISGIKYPRSLILVVTAWCILLVLTIGIKFITERILELFF